MTKSTQLDIRSTDFDLHALELDALLALRLYLDEKEYGNNITQDIDDLDQYPDRLLSSYREEWIVYCKPRLTNAYLERKADEVTQLDAIIAALNACIKRPESQNPQLIHKVRAVQQMLNSDDVSFIESTPARQIRKLIRFDE
jgi:hypothetical protein